MPPSSVYSIGIISLGCAKNLVDTEHMGARLRAEGYRFTQDIAAADILLVNTCAFIEDARKESIDTILEAASMKTKGACRFLIVAGCLSQRYAGDLPAALPEVDAFLGLDQLDEITQILNTWRDQRTAGGNRLDASSPSKRLYEPPPERQVLTGGPFAYVKIAEGCNHRCAFCAIPAIRGRARSRAVGSIRTEVEHLLASGIREINLIAQDTTAYGRDRDDHATLAGLLRELGRIGGDFWIRLLYGFPSSISDTLLETMAGTAQVCHYLDVPIQHSHPDVLRAMGRAATLVPIRRLVRRARKFMPDIALRTTCLVGHPGESDAAFQHLRQFMQTAQFDHAGVFVYSPEEGTRSARATGVVPTAVAESRRDLLMRDQQRRVARQQEKLTGQRDRILIQSSSSDSETESLMGRSQRQAPEVDGVTYVRSTRNPPRLGTFVDVRYRTVQGYDLLAELVT